MAICNFLTLAVVFALLQLKFTTGQKPSPQTNPCMLYNLNTGNMEGGASARVDIYEERKQTVILPISGGKNISLEVNAKDAKAFGVSLGFNGTYVTMSVSKALDRDGTSFHVDDLDVFSFDVNCTYAAANNTQTTKYIRVIVTVKDINDNAPEFVNYKYSTIIQETLPLRSSVFQLTAGDKDAGLNGAIYYSIISGNKFDGAVDATQRKTSTATLTIFVEDSDDLPPTFYHDNCRHTSGIRCDAVIYRTEVISGYMVPGSVLSTVPIVTGHETISENITAFDLDDLNATIAFELIGGSVPSGFANRFMVSSSGPTINKKWRTREAYIATLIQIKPVTRHETKEFSLFLKAKQTDDESKYCIAQIMCIVNPSNFYRPLLTTNADDNVGFVADDAPPGTYVRAAALAELEPLEIRVTDGDLADGDTQGYDYITESIGSKFSIKSFGDRAIISTRQRLDNSVVSRYVVTVQVIERTMLPRIETITIGVVVQPNNDSTYEKKSGNHVCYDGLYGEYCNRTCPDNCARCTSENHCLECERGFFGTICSLPCSRNCLFCNKTDGTCIGFLNCDIINNEIDEKGETYSVLTLILVAVGSLCGMLVIAAFIVVIRRRNFICCTKRQGDILNDEALHYCHTESKSNIQTKKSDNVCQIQDTIELSNVNSGDSQIQTADYENDTPLEHYERLRGTNEENKPYDFLKTAEYEALGERTKQEQQYEGLNISKP